ncbi:hypothetical protein C0J52_24042 [Blattella germanica]|nr:hypothetical protein C0J52_24042 [Blattella germanica]
MYICSLHFSEAKYMSPVSNRLVHDAVPDINLPIYSVSEISIPSDSGSLPACNLSSLLESSPAVNNISSVFSEPASSLVQPLCVSGTSESSLSESSPAVINISSVFSEPTSPLGVHPLCISPLSQPSISGQSSTAINCLPLGVEKGMNRRSLLQKFNLCRKEITPRKEKMLHTLRQAKKKFNRLRNAVKQP